MWQLSQALALISSSNSKPECHESANRPGHSEVNVPDRVAISKLFIERFVVVVMVSALLTGPGRPSSAETISFASKAIELDSVVEVAFADYSFIIVFANALPMPFELAVLVALSGFLP